MFSSEGAEWARVAVEITNASVTMGRLMRTSDRERRLFITATSVDDFTNDANVIAFALRVILSRISAPLL